MGTEITEKNSEIIYQLYLDATSFVQGVSDFEAFKGKLDRYTVSDGSSSLQTFISFFTAINTAFANFRLTIDSLMNKGDRIMVRYTISGLHKGDILGLGPTYQPATITGIDIFRLDKGKIVEHWDAAHQICAIPQFGWRTTKQSLQLSNVVVAGTL